MKDGAEIDDRHVAAGQGCCQHTGIRTLAESALRILAESRQCDRRGDTAQWVERLCDAVVSDSETSHHRVISAMVSSGVCSDEVFDTYLPAVARELGDRWMRDEATFVEVTVGTGRLQTLLRERAERRCAAPSGGTRGILLVLPPFEAHALGVFIAADQMRRAGHSVQLAIGPSAAEVAALVAQRDFAMVGLTCATRRATGELRTFISEMRAAARAPLPPVVIGGPVKESVPDLAQTTGADHVAGDCEEALRLVGLAHMPKTLSM
ncbi:MAG: B12-binding domain-containing protein [Rhodosalinus sp.]|uniref:cobalamin B12-binding domain-containing protein n=2 Tax=Rhodosalinus sp. TaxID=2047741 RepID=UPI00397B1A05